ncbi:putative WPP domain, leucine-rich repeat domain superfamily, WPP domain superfamily [Helianthus annuus]|uniref:Putative WPP domain, Leucine-rich repeat domain, L domain-like protein n=1 Tax=Helianthus annuus TaxID=4232 RepID=A0A251VSB2_HELAN|nr:putative WPP domain, leucine-rich repeat domain superfamily, WPP domain superfamily [Helianthus annuus]KAJ0628677.1 putative WPP domain, leucine-rich repeat domain superfamily, WPP domain superfamily [Helianthus annuus]KAJ0950084.1 putative WPP domain, leucine-rich repeat domain superfamily, WPP domain superfamily [Helianthus annuus]
MRGNNIISKFIRENKQYYYINLKNSRQTDPINFFQPPVTLAVRSQPPAGKNLTTPSILSGKYGLLSKEETQEDAKRIEATSFETANQHFEKEPDGDGGSAVQLYAKQSSTAEAASGKFLEVVELADAASGLAEFIVSRKESLVQIFLVGNKLKDEGVITIAKALEEDFPRLTEVDLSTTWIRRAGAMVLAQAVVGKPGFKVLNINGNYISDEGVEDVKEIFKNSPDLLGPLDYNDPGEGNPFF